MCRARWVLAAVGFIGTILVAGGAGLAAEPVTFDALELAATAYRQDCTEPPPGVVNGQRVATPDGGGALLVEAAGKVMFFDAEVTIPAESPALLAFDTQATQSGWLEVHLTPAKVPPALLKELPTGTWDNRSALRDFRALVRLEPGEWQHHLIDLNRGVYESVTRFKRMYDLRGVRLVALGAEVRQPAEANQRVLLDNVRVLTVTREVMRRDLQIRMAAVRQALAAAPAGVADYWKPRVASLGQRVDAIRGDTLLADAWRDARDAIEAMRLTAHKWPLGARVAEPYAVGIESSLNRVSGRNPMSSFAGQLGSGIAIDAARNEYESAQVVLLPLTTALTKVAMTCSDLRATNGPGRIASANVVCYRQLEQRLRPNPSTPAAEAGWTPDALLPIDGPFDVADTDVEALWVTVYTPDDVPAGRYTGTITITPTNAPAKTVSLSLTVADFAIPRVGQFRVQCHFSINALQNWYGETYTPEIRRAYYRLLVDHRFSPTSQYHRMLSPDQSDIPWIMRDGGNVIVIGGYHTHSLEPEKIDAWYRWLVDNGYVDRAIIYIGDETDDFEGIKAKAKTIRTRWPKLHIMVGGSKPRPELEGYVDVWDPITSGGNVYDFDAHSAAQAIGRGEEVFWYTCIGPLVPYPNCCNNDPLTAIRALWWQAWKYGVTGWEYWAMNYWDPNVDLATGDIPWPTSRTDQWGSESYKWSNGDGLMVYPGPNGQPLACTRLAVKRDAIEDWEILFQLIRAVELAERHDDAELKSIAAKARKLLDVPEHITSDLTHWNTDPKVYFGARVELYSLLGTLRKRLGAQAVDDYTGAWVAKHKLGMQQQFEARVTRTQLKSPDTNPAE